MMALLACFSWLRRLIRFQLLLKTASRFLRRAWFLVLLSALVVIGVLFIYFAHFILLDVPRDTQVRLEDFDRLLLYFASPNRPLGKGESRSVALDAEALVAKRGYENDGPLEIETTGNLRIGKLKELSQEGWKSVPFQFVHSQVAERLAVRLMPADYAATSPEDICPCEWPLHWDLPGTYFYREEVADDAPMLIQITGDYVALVPFHKRQHLHLCELRSDVGFSWMPTVNFRNLRESQLGFLIDPDLRERIYVAEVTFPFFEGPDSWPIAIVSDLTLLLAEQATFSVAGKTVIEMQEPFFALISSLSGDLHFNLRENTHPTIFLISETPPGLSAEWRLHQGGPCYIETQMYEGKGVLQIGSKSYDFDRMDRLYFWSKDFRLLTNMEHPWEYGVKVSCPLVQLNDEYLRLATLWKQIPAPFQTLIVICIGSIFAGLVGYIVTCTTSKRRERRKA